MAGTELEQTKATHLDLIYGQFVARLEPDGAVSERGEAMFCASLFANRQIVKARDWRVVSLYDPH